MVPSRRLSQGRSRSLLKAVALAYAIALATLPLGHHDLLCHLKSSTHCSTCHVGSAEGSSTQPALLPVVLADAGRIVAVTRLLVGFSFAATAEGRAPPAIVTLDSLV